MICRLVLLIGRNEFILRDITLLTINLDLKSLGLLLHNSGGGSLFLNLRFWLSSNVTAIDRGLIGWIKIDAKPIKQALSTWVTKWVFLYTQYLQQKVINSMDELYEFMKKGEKVLEKDPSAVAEAPAEGEEAPAPAEDGGEDKQAMLYEVMAFMRDVRKRQDKTDAMFDPLVQTVALLKTYGINLQDVVLKQLEEAPLAWSALKKKMLNVREKLSSMQQLEARKIRDSSDALAQRLRTSARCSSPPRPSPSRAPRSPWITSSRRTTCSTTSTTA